MAMKKKIICSGWGESRQREDSLDNKQGESLLFLRLGAAMLFEGDRYKWPGIRIQVMMASHVGSTAR